MHPHLIPTLKKNMASLLAWLKQAFDKTATWVTQLSWWKFFLFAILVLIAGSLLQETLFRSSSHTVIIQARSSAHHRIPANIVPDGNTSIQIDGTGIHIQKTTPNTAPGATPATPPSATPDINIELPAGIGQEVKDAIEEAVDNAAEKKAASYRETSSEWFMNFVLLLLIGLFGTKALMGGKKRAEAQALAATAAAEREALQRQVSEAKMQMMQAQVEPHFLFNTLASVEHLIETDPPRASAMQRSFILYLRAVLPQLRENQRVTHLGQEADMVRAYLDLLKMRMEERLQIDLQIPDNLRDAAFPPMMLQPLVENAIKHGLERKPEGGTLRIFAAIVNDKLRVTVADNGLGMDASAGTSNSTGIGLQNIRERLALLYGQQAQLIITPNSPQGVCATIEVPYRLSTQTPV